MTTSEPAKPRRSDLPEERRQFHRIHLDAPIPARMHDVPVQVLDLSLNGARIVGEARFGPGSQHELQFDWHERSVRVVCTVVRCTLYSFAKAPGAKSTYQSGLRITETIGDSDRVMRELIASYVIRALEEQKANARGIPPLGPYAYIEGKGDRYRRCELVDGKWRRSETGRPDQPSNGFTVSAEVRAYYVDLLCETYQALDEDGRRLTQTLAQLSISRAEGVPTRRYIP